MSVEPRIVERVQVSKSKVQELLSGGMDKETIRSTHYSSLNKSQWNKALKAMGLSNVRAKRVDFVIEEDVETENKGE